MKIWQVITAIALLTCCMTSGATEEEQVVHFHPITPEEYEAILGLTNGSPVISEARLIASGLAAIKSLAVGIKTGFAAAWWLPTLLASFGATTPKETETNTDKVRDGYPLCVIRPGYFAEDDEETPQRRGSSKRSGSRQPLPLAHCIVVVKQSAENGGVAAGIPQIANPTWSYPPPYPQPRPIATERPNAAPGEAGRYPYYPYYPNYSSYPGYNPKYPGYPQHYGYPGYYATYPAAAPVTEAPATVAPPTEEPTEEEEEPTEPPHQIIEHKKRLRHNIHKHLHHRSAPRPAYDWPLTPEHTPYKPRSKKKRDEHATYPPPQNYAQISNYPSVGGYEQAYYPQFNYQSNYPKVSYTHALPYPAPVYREWTTPKPTKKIVSVDSEEADNSAEYIKVRNN